MRSHAHAMGPLSMGAFFKRPPDSRIHTPVCMQDGRYVRLNHDDHSVPAKEEGVMRKGLLARSRKTSEAFRRVLLLLCVATISQVLLSRTAVAIETRIHPGPSGGTDGKFFDTG